MTDNSNQYPRLLWQHNPEPVHKGYIARPYEGGQARVYYAANHPAFTRWAWVVTWPDRFARHGGEADKQSAAEAATVAFWDLMEETAGWVAPPPPPPPPAVDLVAKTYWTRVEAWMADPANFVELGERLSRFRIAAIKGPSIVCPEVDHAMWTKLTNYWSRHRIYHP